tara:strand:+ start:7169 stop:9277 length:2109 start_codon:yes stop_codon:yes gene_type:complete
MANFTVSYLFNLRDQFSAKARKISSTSNNAKKSVYGLGKAFNGVERGANRAGTAVGRLAHKMRAMRTVGRGVGSGGFLGSMGVLGGGMGIKSMITKMMSFQDAINSVEAKFSKGKGMDPKRLEEMRRGVKMLGKTTRYTTTEVGNALNMLAMAGQTYEQAIGSDKKGFTKGALATTLNLAAATGSDLPRSADIVTNIMSAYGVPVSKLSTIADTLTYAVNSSNQNIYEMAEAMKMAGPASKAFGVSMEQTSAATMVLANAGIKGSLAGTGFRRMVTRLVSVNSQSAKVFKKLGVDPKDFVGKDGKLKDIWGAVDTMKKSGAKPSDIMKIFGDRAGPIMLRLMTQSVEEMRALEAALKDTKGAAAASAKIMEKGLGGAIRKMMSNLEAVTLTIGDSGMASDVKWLAERVIGLADSFSTLSDGTKRLVGRGLLAFAGFAAIVIPLGMIAMMAGALLGPLAALGGALRVVLGLIWAFGAGMAGAFVAPIARAARMLGAGGALAMGIRLLMRLARKAIVFTILWEGANLLMNWEKVKAAFADPINIDVNFPKAPKWLKFLVERWGKAKEALAGVKDMPNEIAQRLGAAPIVPNAKPPISGRLFKQIVKGAPLPLNINPNTPQRMLKTAAAAVPYYKAAAQRHQAGGHPYMNNTPSAPAVQRVEFNSPTVTVKVDASGMATASVPLPAQARNRGESSTASTANYNVP